VPDGPDATAEQIEDLAALLMDHPFAADQPLLHTIERSVTTGEAQAEARALAAELRALGVEPHQAVAVQLPNGPDVVIAMVGIWLAGAVFVPVNPRLPEAEIEGVLGPSAPAAIIGPEGIRALPDARTYETGTAFILWTSGTTGRPKPILHTHRGYGELLDRVLTPLRAGGAPSTSAQPARPPSPNLIPVSLALNAGIYNALFGLRAGAALVIMDRFETATFAELVRRFEIRSTVLPPAAIAMLNDDPEVTDLSPLRYVRSITSPLSPLQARRFTESFGVFVLNGYGQAEVGEVIGWTAADAKSHPEKVGAVGRPHAGVDLKIVDPGGAAVAPGEVGELLVRPPNMASGYASGTELSDRIDEEGYLATGDLGRIDEDGFVWIEGRSGDLINRGGNKVFPDEVEEVLRLSPHVREAAVVGAPDERLGEVPVAFIVTIGEVGDDELVALCRDHLTPYKIPVDFVRVDALPKNEIGKLLRRQLAAGYPR
jgi:acyl-CoA synthetase (AMP-forming)/AMP-acid ligase II